MSAEPVALELRGLGKTYTVGFRRKRVEALAGLDLRVETGSIYGFVGPNGAGKSTTIKMLVGLSRPTRGEAFLFGQPIANPGSRTRIGYLPENPSFHDFLRPLEALGYFGRLSGMGGRELSRRAEELLELVGLTHARELTVRKFSKGMVQRLGLAQALIHDPPLLILDEPMSGLDPIGRKELRDLIVELRRRGKTIFFSTHILPDVETICDRVGMLFHGRLVAEGALSQLLDGTVRAVELRCEGLGPPAWEAVAALGTSSPGAAGVLVLPDMAAANRASALVLQGGGRLVSLQPVRESLEQTFVRLAAAEKARVD